MEGGARLPPYPPPASNLDASVILSPKGTVDKITCVQGLQRVKQGVGGRSARALTPTTRRTIQTLLWLVSRGVNSEVRRP